MKKILFVLSVLLFADFSSYAQAPQGINYQGVARDPSGNAYGNTNVSVQITLTQNGNPTPVYQEHQTVTTDTFGLYSIVIGSPAAVITSGSFASIPWSGGNILAQVDIDPLGGTAWTTISTMNLQSVPYALYAQNAGNSGSGTVTSITAGPGLTGTPSSTITTSGTIDLPTFPGVANTWGSSTQIPSFTVDSYGRITSASNQSFTPGNVVIAGSGLTSVVASNTITLNAMSGTPMWSADKLQITPISSNLPNTNDVLQFDGTNWTPTPSTGSPWTLSGGNIFPATLSNNVGIGTSTPVGMLGIVNTGTATTTAFDLTNNSPGYGINITNNYTGGGAPMLKIFHADPTPAVYVTGQNASNTADVMYVETHGPGNAIKGFTDNSGAAIIGYSHGSAAGSSGIYGLQDNFGSAGIFHVYNAGNTSAGIDVMTQGSGYSGVFTGGAGLQTDKIQITGGATNGYVLTSDPSGNATWQAPSGGGGLPAPQMGSILFGNSPTTWAATDPTQVSSDGTSITVTNTTSVGTAGTFNATDPSASNAPALLATTNSSTGYAMRADNNGGGAAIVANSNGFYAIAGNMSGGSGHGVAGWLRNSASGGYGIYGLVDPTSSGVAGYFENQNPSSTQPVMQVVNGAGALGHSATFSGGNGVEIDNLQVLTNLYFPFNAGSGKVLTSDIVGNAAWQTLPTGVSSISANPPLYNVGTATNPILDMTPSDGSTPGWLSVLDWNNFNSKLSTVSVNAPFFGNGTGGAPLQLGLNSGNIFVGSATNLATPVNMTGDMNITNTGVTTVTGLQGRTVSTSAPAANQVLQYNGAQWAPTMVALLPPGTPNQMLYNSGGTWVVSNTNNLAFNGTNMGIGNSAPSYPLDMSSTNATTTSNFINTGSGRAGNFQVINAASTVTEALNVTNNATGNSRGATFNTSNAGNTASAVHAITGGSGNAITAITTGSGNGISASTTSTGYSGLFSGGAGVKTDKITISNGAAVGSILTANSAAGDVIWSTPSAVVASGGAWTIGGNAAALGNFLGTTNTVPLEIATANATPQPILFKVGGLAAGNEKMRIDANGSVGIGANTPATTLHALASQAEIRVESSGGAFTSGFGIKTATQQWFIGQENGTSQLLRIKDVTAGIVRMEIEKLNGNVGINKTNPAAQLDVASSSTVTTIAATNTGSAGRAGDFLINNAANTDIALMATTTGTGNAGYFSIGNAGNTNAVIYATTNGKGSAGVFSVTNSSGTGVALDVANQGLSQTGSFITNNSANANYALNVATNGTGNAGNFQINNASSNGTVVYAATTGSGIAVSATSNAGSAVNATAGAGTAVMSRSSGNNATIDVANTGSGNAISAISGAGNSADVVKSTSTAGGTAIVGINSGSSGNGGFFSVTGAGNTSPALQVNNTSTGFSGNFVGGQGLKTDGFTGDLKVCPNGGIVLGGTDYFVMIPVGTTGNITWPAPTPANKGKVYVIKNLGGAYNVGAGSSYVSATGVAGQNNIPATTIIRLVSDGAAWQAW